MKPLAFIFEQPSYWLLMTARNSYRQLVLLEILSGKNVEIQHLDNHLNKVNISAFQTNKPISVFAWFAEVNYS